MPYPSDGDDRTRLQPGPAERVTVAGRLVARPGAIDEVLALFTELINHVRAHEPGTERYLLEQNEADPSELWLHEAYQDQDAFLAHGHSPVVRGLSDQINALLTEIHLARTRRLEGK